MTGAFAHTSSTTRSLPYERDAAVWVEHFAHLPGLVFLDSRKRRSEVGRFDIITALPDRIYRLSDYMHPSAWMAAIESDIADAPQSGRSRIALGFFDFESAASQLGVPRAPLRPATAGVFSWHILQDHQLGRAWLVIDDDIDPETLQCVEQCLTTSATHPPVRNDFCLHSPFEPDLSADQYAADVNAIRRYIEAGDCYQVNYAHRFSAACAGSPLSAYLALRNAAPGDFSAYLNLDADHAVLSLSPERFLSVEGRKVKTQPIKGTRPRGQTPEEDARLADELKHSAKDRAENVMIVDLLRNDLGKVCEPGSVVTTELCSLHSFDNVHHLVSMVEGVLTGDITPGQAMVACSPGGSITGAPKKRAVQIIQELEQAPRGVYCGSVFALGSDGWLQSSIAIRTLEIVGDQIYCWGGGGIVHESEAAAEYQETLDKVGVFMRSLSGSRR